jgi:hypothetical protein
LTLQRLASAGLSWPLPAEMTDAALEAALFAAVGTKQGHRRHLEPDWCEIHRELKRKHVTPSSAESANQRYRSVEILLEVLSSNGDPRLAPPDCFDCMGATQAQGTPCLLP